MLYNHAELIIIFLQTFLIFNYIYILSVLLKPNLMLMWIRINEILRKLFKEVFYIYIYLFILLLIINEFIVDFHC